MFPLFGQQVSAVIHSILFSRYRILLILQIILLLANLPFLSGTCVPIHDTMVTLNSFYYYYSEMFLRFQVPQWSPFNAYGLPSHYAQIISLTPFSYLSMLFGLIFRVEDAFWLFRFSIVLEQAVFLGGLYMLCNVLFRHQRTVFFVCLGAALTTVWFSQVWNNFRFFYLFPFSAALLVLFFKKERSEFLWLSGIVVLLSLIGNVPYFIGPIVLVHFILFLVLLSKDFSVVKRIIPLSGSDLVTFVIFLFAALLYYCYMRNITNYVDLFSGQRDSTGGVLLKDFIAYEGLVRGDVLLRSFLSARPLFLTNGAGVDNTVYAGLFTFFGLLWLPWAGNKRSMWAFLLPAAILIGLTLGGIVAQIFYYFPLMKFYRPVGLLYGYIKIILLICSGFGMDWFWELKTLRKFYALAGALAIAMLLLGICRGFSFELSSLSTFFSSGTFRLSAYVFLLGTLLILCVSEARHARSGAGALFSRKAGRISGVAILVVFILELLSFRYQTYLAFPQIAKGAYNVPQIFTVRKMAYQEERQFVPKEGRSKDAYDLVTRQDRVNPAIYDFDFVQFDPCLIMMRHDLACTGVRQLYLISPALLAVFGGCQYPKLHFVSRVYDGSSEKVGQIFQQTSRSLEQMILNGGMAPYEAIVRTSVSWREVLMLSTGRREAAYAGMDASGQARMQDFSANKAVIDVNNKSLPGGWLVYADAFHPGWKAFIDGQQVKIEKAYLAFKAVYVPFGHHVVKFVFYDPLGTPASILMSAWGCLGAMGLLWLLFIGLTDNFLVVKAEKNIRIEAGRI